MQKMSRDLEEADYLVDMAQKHPDTLLNLDIASTSKWKSVHQQLLDLYLEESQRQPMNKKLRSTSHLLAKLVAKKHLNTLIVNMYPGNEGYSLMLKGRNGEDSETVRLPYEETDLLEYIDAEELPPVLVDLLDKAQANLFYSGCIIVELRDFRRSSSTDYDQRYVLLRPTPHTLLCDINNLTNDGHRWTEEDKFQLESQLLLHTTEPLCLDPSPTVFHVSNSLNNRRHTFNTKALKGHVKKFSQVSVNKRRKLAECPSPSNLRLHDFVMKKRERGRQSPLVNLKVAKSVVDMWKQRDIQLKTPESVEVDKYAKAIEPPNDKLICNNVPVTIEEFTMESERSKGKVLITKLIIQQRMSDDTYLGELHTDRDYIQGYPLKGTMCKFSLGTRGNVDKYIKQFTEIFTEEGRRAVKITHQVIGQKPVITHTHPPSTTTATSAQSGVDRAQAQSIITQATNLATSLAGQVGPGGDNKKASPLKLSLQINHNTPGAGLQGSTAPGASTGGAVTLQQQVLAAQRARQMGLQQLQKSASSTTTTSSGQLPTYTQAITSGSGTSSAGSTPPPNVTVSSASKPITAVLQVPPGDGSDDASTTQTGNIIPPNISITNLQGNVNITNIQGIIPGLPNVQVSLAGGTIPAGSITLPVNVLSSGGVSTSLTSPTGVIMTASSTQGGTLTSPPPLVSMVTGTNTSTSTTSSVMSAGHSNMIQLPLGVTQLIPTANLKNAPAGLRAATPLSLVQVQGQPMQLLSAANLGQPRGQIGQPPTAHPGTTSPRPVISGQRPGLTLQPVQINPQQQQQLAQLHFQQRQQMQLQQQQQMKPPKSKKKKSKS